MRRVLCFFGRHSWERNRNPDMGGPLAEYDICKVCHKEKNVYGKPPKKGVASTGL